MLYKIDQHKDFMYNFSGYTQEAGISFNISLNNRLFAVYLSVICLFVCIFSYNHIHTFRNSGSVYTLIGMSFTGYICMVFSNDFFNIYVFLEIASITTYCLLSLKAHEQISSLVYLIVGTICSCLYLFGIGILYIVTANLNVDLISAKIEVNLLNQIAFSMILIALLIKLACFPICIWIINCYSAANYFFTSFFTAIASNVFLYLLYKLNTSLLFDFNLTYIINWGAFCTIIYSTYKIYIAQNLKTVLILSSLINNSYILLCIAQINRFDNHLFMIIFIQIINHGFTKTFLFLITNNNSCFGKSNSKSQKIHIYTIIFLFASLVGIPPLPGFISKIIFYKFMVQQQAWSAVLIVTITSLIVLQKFIVYVTSFNNENCKNYISDDKTYNTHNNTILNYVILFIIVVTTIYEMKYISLP